MTSKHWPNSFQRKSISYKDTHTHKRKIHSGSLGKEWRQTRQSSQLRADRLCFRRRGMHTTNSTMAAPAAPYIVRMVGRASGPSTLAWLVQGTVLMSDRTGRVDGRTSPQILLQEETGTGPGSYSGSPRSHFQHILSRECFHALNTSCCPFTEVRPPGSPAPGGHMQGKLGQRDA